MQKHTNDIIHIVKSAVTGVPVNLSDGLDMPDIFQTAQKHKAVTLAYYGLKNCGHEPEGELKSAVSQIMIQEMFVSQKQMYYIQKISEAFQAGGVDFILLKGSMLKGLYPKPEMRRMGDIDILIKEEQYDVVRSIMEKLGFTFQRETGHELIWCHDIIMVELHKILVPSYNKELHSYLGDGWKRAVAIEGSRYTFAENDMFVYLFTHFAKHFRDSGIGITHMCDLYVYMKEHMEILDFTYIERELKKLRLYTFYLNVRETLTVWFENGVPTEMSDYITEVILSSGVYGLAEQAVIGEALRNSANYGNERRGRIHKVLRMFFPTLSALKTRYHVLKKHPYLYPVIWVLRTASWPLVHKNRMKEKINEMKSVDENQLAARKRALEYVGLYYYADLEQENRVKS